MRCPYCETLMSPHGGHCEACRLQLARDHSGHQRAWFPPIRPGEHIARLDFRTEPLPGSKNRETHSWPDGSKRSPTHEGIELVIVGSGDYEFFLRYVRVRDASVRAQVTVRSPNVSAFVGLRHQKLGKMDVGYRMTVRPDLGEYRIARIASSPKATVTTQLLPATKHPLVAAVGAPMVLELGAQGPTVQASINGTPIWSVHDPVLGIGAPSIGAGVSGDNTGGVLFQWFDLRTVAP